MFGRMKLYTVHLKPEDGLHKKPVFVREGFNVYAFAFTGLWAIYQRLWKPLLLIMIFNGTLGYLLAHHILLKPSYLAMQFGFNLLVGFQANDWVRARLAANGYVLADVSAADSLLRAEQRYLERALSHS